jgi:alkaline phosphatase D
MGMPPLNRRAFGQLALALGASSAYEGLFAAAPRPAWRETREAFAEGVASADPDAHSVLLWTRTSMPEGSGPHRLHVEIASDAAFSVPVASSIIPLTAESDWTCRVLVGGLKPASTYWYRFTDDSGRGSRIGRTLTAPDDNDERAVSFAFVSCQNANQGAQNAYRRMIFEDERAPENERLGFVLHLGDFIYEIVWYPEDRPQGMYDRRLRDVVRYADGEKIRDFHIPTTLADYRSVYRAYLHDPDLQDARARWPFVNMWDNHEFSWLGWQSLQKFEGKTFPAQMRKVAANQAFFEYQPARTLRPHRTSLDVFGAPSVKDAPITRFDEHGLGIEPNNLTAIGSLTGYRALRWGRHVEVIVTDQRSYRSEEPTDMAEAQPLNSSDFPGMMPERATQIMDAGREYHDGQPPAAIRSRDGGVEVANAWRERPAQTVLGAQQKAWFLARLKNSSATWKLWGNTTATLQMRADPQNLPSNLPNWRWDEYAIFSQGDWATAYVERAEIYDFIRAHHITGFVTVAGDRHSFWAGLATKSLPPEAMEPVGIAFVTGSISAPGLVEAYEHALPKQHPLRALYLGQGPGDTSPQPTVNLLVRHGVRACLEYAASGDIAKARMLSNPALSPHLSFVDMGGHGYAVVRASAQKLDTEFVCIPRPIERSERADGGPLRYRVRFSTSLWQADQRPSIATQMLEGDATFSI